MWERLSEDSARERVDEGMRGPSPSSGAPQSPEGGSSGAPQSPDGGSSSFASCVSSEELNSCGVVSSSEMHRKSCSVAVVDCREKRRSSSMSSFGNDS
eukprot:CAMPEP_0180638160 /NCGR_PEP_ID=MMETSP1037_2-20121125/44142_1 /TAXON_ID=632150 /ORGANISM="Azadinium spinosum, Strain 3D9" /LENGTH=97 /DNA_ID=CAMNT_0022659601 /DNA_START=590 /DNA_END=883 /DNA_ORIENTATION=+